MSEAASRQTLQKYSRLSLSWPPTISNIFLSRIGFLDNYVFLELFFSLYLQHSLSRTNILVPDRIFLKIELRRSIFEIRMLQQEVVIVYNFLVTINVNINEKIKNK